MNLKARACLLTFALSVEAQASDVGVTGATFLKIHPGARPTAMGRAFSAVADDVHAIYWNPAGLGQLEKSEVSATYLDYIQEVHHGFVAAAHPLGDRGTVAMAFTYLRVGGIEGRTSDTEEADRIFGANDMAVQLAWAHREPFPEMAPDLAVGLDFKLIRQKLDDSIAQAYAGDFGFLYRTPVEGLKLAASLHNLGTDVKFHEVADPLPLTLRLGAAKEFVRVPLTLAADVENSIHDEKTYGALGLEFVPVKMFALRGGYRFGEDTENLGKYVGVSGGLGIRLGATAIDYAFLPFGDLGKTHRFSLTFRF